MWVYLCWDAPTAGSNRCSVVVVVIHLRKEIFRAITYVLLHRRLLGWLLDLVFSWLSSDWQTDRLPH